MIEKDDQGYWGKSMNCRLRKPHIVKMVSMGFLLLSLSSCVAQQADLVKLERDLAKLDEEKRNLVQTLAEANQAIQESQAVLAQQKSEVSELVRARAQFKSDLRSLREENLAQLTGELETESNRLQRLEGLVDDLIQEVKILEGDVNTRDQARVKEITTLRENVKKDFAQQNKTMKENFVALRVSLVEFEKAMGAIVIEKVGAEQNRAVAAENKMRNEFEAQQAAIRIKLDSEAKLLSDLNVKAGAEFDVLKKQDEGTHQNLENLAKSIGQLRTGLAQVGEQLGSKIDEHTQSLDKSDGRLKQVENQIPVLSKELKSDTEALRVYLDTDIRTSIKSLANVVEAEKIRGLESSKKLEGLFQAVDKATRADLNQTKTQMAAQSQYINELNQSVVSAREVLDSMGGMLGKRSDDQMQQVGILSAKLEQMKQAQSSVLSQQDANVQSLSSHLKEVTASIQSVVKSLDQIKTTLTLRLDQQNARLEEQDQRLMETAQSSVSSEKVNQELAANVQYMNQLGESLRQLKAVVQKISSKLGGKVDGHESQLAGLKQQIQRLRSTLSSMPPAKASKP